MITIVNTQAEADAIQGPKHIWYDIGRIVVYTGEDIPAIPSQRVISTVEFRSRFTDAEMDAIMSLAYSGTGDVTARRILLKLQTRADIDLDDQRVIDGMGYWVSQGVLTQARADAILA
jgi:hypothetical protein